LPISSDGHLVLAGYLTGRIDERFLDLVIFLHGGSLLVIIGYYRRELFGVATRSILTRPDTPDQRRLLLALLVGTAVTGVIGILAKDTIERLQHPAVAACGLLFTGAELLSLYFVRPGTKRSISVPLAVLIGIFQALAILPGVSRSGSTITVGLWAGLAPGVAATFSFLLAVPAISGALLLDVDQFQRITAPFEHLVAGFFTCAVVSYVALRLVLHYVERGSIRMFGWYCLAVGIGFLVYLGMMGR
jgi:undecaprenyl-diphosphatase